MLINGRGITWVEFLKQGCLFKWLRPPSPSPSLVLKSNILKCKFVLFSSFKFWKLQIGGFQWKSEGFQWIKGFPIKIWGSPMKIKWFPIKIWGSPIKICGFPMKILGSPMKIWGFPVKIWEFPTKIRGSPTKIAVLYILLCRIVAVHYS